MCIIVFVSVQQVIDAVVKESKKENMKYKMAAMECMAEILDSYSVDRYAEFSATFLPILEKVGDGKFYFICL